MDECTTLGEQLDQSKVALENIQTQLRDILMGVPNLAHESVPIGKNEDENEEIRCWGEPTQFAFEPRDHVDLGESLHLMDFNTASKISGARFVVMQGKIARMHRALIQFMLDVHISDHGYEEVYVPYLVNSESLYGTGQLPKFAEDQFAIKGDENYYLIPTAEVPVTNMFRNEIVDHDKLPLKFVAHTPCFRSEAGSHGKDTRGLIRQHRSSTGRKHPQLQNEFSAYGAAIARL